MNNPGTTLEDRLISAAGRPSGFDYMRLILALAVICFHSIVTSYGYAAQHAAAMGPWRPVITAVLPMFFALSGFLVAGSLERSKTLVTFLGLRIIRIVPALACEVLLSALILGPLLTSLPLKDYFLHPTFASYFLNILGDIHYALPGLFLDNPVPNVMNGQLWTVPYELLCYIVLAGLSLLGIFKRRQFLLLFLIALYGLQCLKMLYDIHTGNVNELGDSVSGRILVMVFVAGILLYRYREKVPYHPLLFLVSAAAMLVLLSLPFGGKFVAIPAAYVTVYLGLMMPQRNKILLSGDYSYGLFLYGYPIQQTIASLGPDYQHWYIVIALALPIAALAAVASWWTIEKPALKLKFLLKRWEDRYLRYRAGNA